MHYSNVLLVAASLASMAVAQKKPNAFTTIGENGSCTPGKQCELEWDNIQGDTITIMLRDGDPNNLNSGVTVVDNLPNSGKASFLMPKDLESGNYAFMTCADGDCKDEKNTNYSGSFAVQGSGKAPTASDSATASGTAEVVTGTATGSAEATATATATETVVQSVTESVLESITGAVTVTGSPMPTSFATQTVSATETTTATETETEEEPSSSANVSSPDGSAASVTRSSSLAMAICVFAAIFYLN